MGKTNQIVKNILLLLISAIFVSPIVIIFFNSFKSKLFINNEPFVFPNSESFVGVDNYIEGVKKIEFFRAFSISLLITVSAVLLIILVTSLTGWYIVRVKNMFSSILYFMFAFSMMVPFQMVMFTLVKISNILYLDNLPGIIFIYVGFGSGLSVFMFTGFIKSVPVSLEEAAMMDGCSIMGIYGKIILPVLKPIVVTVSVLNAMWIWNDYLLPYLVIGSEYRTIPVAIQYLRGGYGSIDLGLMLAMLVFAVIPIIIFYALCQKWIIKGVLSGAVKG